jgi:hypothetical protein
LDFIFEPFFPEAGEAPNPPRANAAPLRSGGMGAHQNFCYKRGLPIKYNAG